MKFDGKGAAFLLILLLASFSEAAFSQVKNAVAYHKHGTRKLLVPKQDGVVHGMTTVYHTNGAVKILGQVIRGEISGQKKLFEKRGIEVSTAEIKPFQSVRKQVKELVLGLQESPDKVIEPAEGNRQVLEIDGTLQGRYMLDFNASKGFIEVNYKDGVFDGPLVGFYKTGNELVEAQYLDGMLHGPYVRYDKPFVKGRIHVRGDVLEKGTYRDGRLDGKVTVYRSTKKRLAELQFAEGKLNGVSSYFVGDDKLREKCHFEMNQRSGDCSIISEDGIVLFQRTYLNDSIHGKYVERHKNGKLKLVSNYLSGNLHGTTTVYDSEGRKTEERKHVNGKRDGQTRHFFPDQKVKRTEDFSDGKRHGQVIFYYPSGKRLATLEYNRGLKHGKQLSYFESGSVREVGKFLYGKQQGFTDRFNEQGVRMSGEKINTEGTGEVFSKYEIFALQHVIRETEKE